MVETPPLSVLVVDDEAAIGALLERVLAAHQVTAHTDPAAALVALRKGLTPDVVLCDVNFKPPLMAVETFFAQLRWEWPALARHVVFMTGGVFDPDVARFLATTGAARVEKPFQFATLRAALQLVAVRRGTPSEAPRAQ
jgi:two-component system, cell cycle sensor histidine kinase and response regulator CckA